MYEFIFLLVIQYIMVQSAVLFSSACKAFTNCQNVACDTVGWMCNARPEIILHTSSIVCLLLERNSPPLGISQRHHFRFRPWTHADDVGLGNPTGEKESDDARKSPRWGIQVWKQTNYTTDTAVVSSKSMLLVIGLALALCIVALALHHALVKLV